MKSFILKNRPYKWCLMIVLEGTSKNKPFEILYLGFHSKSRALIYYNTYEQLNNVLYATLYKRTNILIKVFNKVCKVLNEPINL